VIKRDLPSDEESSAPVSACPRCLLAPGVCSGGPFACTSEYMERRAQLVLHELCLLELASMATSAAEDETLLQALLSPPPPSDPTCAPTAGSQKVGFGQGDCEKGARVGGHPCSAARPHAARGARDASGSVGEKSLEGTAVAPKLGVRGREAHECLVAAIAYRLTYKRIVLRGLAGTRQEEEKAGIAGLPTHMSDAVRALHSAQE
jgi:hypothetical protein